MGGVFRDCTIYTLVAHADCGVPVALLALDVAAPVEHAFTLIRIAPMDLLVTLVATEVVFLALRRLADLFPALDFFKL